MARTIEDFESTYTYVEDEEGHTSIEIVDGSGSKQRLEKSWLSMNLEVFELAFRESYVSTPNEEDLSLFEERKYRRLTGKARLGEDRIGLIYTRNTTSTIEVTILEINEEEKKDQLNKYFLSGFRDDDERSLNSPPGTFFLNLFVSSSRFENIKTLVKKSELKKLYIRIRTGVLPNLYNEFTTGDWPTVFRYLDHREIIRNSDEMPADVSAKGLIRKSGFELDITIDHLPVFVSSVNNADLKENASEDGYLHQDEEPEETLGAESKMKPRTKSLDRDLGRHFGKISAPLWILLLVYTVSQIVG